MVDFQGVRYCKKLEKVKNALKCYVTCKMKALARKLVTMRVTLAGYAVAGIMKVPHVRRTRNEEGT